MFFFIAILQYQTTSLLTDVFSNAQGPIPAFHTPTSFALQTYSFSKWSLFEAAMFAGYITCIKWAYYLCDCEVLQPQ